MPKTKISEFSATPGNNTDIDGINISEGCAPSGINDAIRELMAQLKDFQAGTAGDSFNGPIGTTTPAAGVFTNLSASGTFALTGDQVQISEGGTGQTTANAAFNALAPSQSTHAGKYLKTDGTNTSWDALDISTADITGTLPVANGGTGVTSSTGTGSVVLSASPTFTGTVNGAALTLSSSLTLSGGTANGVAYLNGSKVLTTGSALTFDGTNFATTGSGTFSGILSRIHAQGTDAYITNTTTGKANTVMGFNDSGSTTAQGIPTGYAYYGTLQSYPIGFTSGGYLTNSISSTAHIWNTTGSEQMRLTSTGLGIGTSSPGRPLDVIRGTAGFVSRMGFSSGVSIYQYTDANAAYISTATNLYNAFGINETSSYLNFYTANAERMRLDSSGNLGLGVTPSAWSSSYKVLQLNTQPAVWGSSDALFLTVNQFQNTSGSNRYIANGFATQYRQDSGQHQWYTAASGTAGNAITFTQAMTLDASGNLGVGTTSPQRKLDIYDATAPTFALHNSTSGTGSTDGFLLFTLGADTTLVNYENGYMAFSTNATERARITSGGYFKASNNGSYFSSTGAYHELRGDGTGRLFIFENYSASGAVGGRIHYSAQAPNNTGAEFLYCSDTGGERASIRSNGGLANYSGNDVNLSDRREKTNFAPAKDYLDTICAIPVQTFNYIDQSEDDPGLTLGVVAQDVQAVAPELVMESNWGTKDDPKMRLSIYQTDLQYALMKCIQELKAQNDDLRARVAQLEAK